MKTRELAPVDWEVCAVPPLPVPEVHEFPPQIGKLIYEAARERFEQQFHQQQEARHVGSR
jgi:hypothetical protein